MRLITIITFISIFIIGCHQNDEIQTNKEELLSFAKELGYKEDAFTFDNSINDAPRLVVDSFKRKMVNYLPDYKTTQELASGARAFDLKVKETKSMNLEEAKTKPYFIVPEKKVKH